MHWSIRLILPDHSLLLAVPEIQPYLTGYDAELLGHQWRAADPEMDVLQRRIAALVEEGGDFAGVRRMISGKTTAPYRTDPLRTSSRRLNAPDLSTSGIWRRGILPHELPGDCRVGDDHHLRMPCAELRNRLEPVHRPATRRVLAWTYELA